MPRISHYARKEWVCGRCGKPILMGTKYRWDSIGKYRDNPIRIIRVHPECRRWRRIWKQRS